MPSFINAIQTVTAFFVLTSASAGADDDPCSPNPCQNDARCLVSNLDPSRVRCICQRGWVGDYCEKEMNPCDYVTCMHGGSCEKISTTRFLCHCRPGWTGYNCATEITPCKEGKCRNGGTCVVVTPTTYKCECAPGWTGTNCLDEVNVCKQSNPCKNGGMCVKFGNSYKCECLTGWAGDNCEIDKCPKVAPDMYHRINCGWSNIDPADCRKLACCYDDSTKLIPWCYYTDYETMCNNIPQNERSDCGFPGVSYIQCIGRGCCFDDDEETNPNGPVCFRKSDPVCVNVPAEQRISRGTAHTFSNRCVSDGYCYDTSVEDPNLHCFERPTRD